MVDHVYEDADGNEERIKFSEPKVRNFTCKKGHEFSSKDGPNSARGHSLTFYDGDHKEIASTGSYCPICLCEWIREHCEVEESE